MENVSTGSNIFLLKLSIMLQFGIITRSSKCRMTVYYEFLLPSQNTQDVTLFKN